MIRLKDLSQVVRAPDVPTSDVLSGLNSSKYLFFCVVQNDGKLLGTITDGDIRRAMLDGATVRDPASRCMHRGAVTGILGDDAENERRLRRVPFCRYSMNRENWLKSSFQRRLRRDCGRHWSWPAGLESVWANVRKVRRSRCCRLERNRSWSIFSTIWK